MKLLILFLITIHTNVESINNTITKEGLIRDEKKAMVYLADVDAQYLIWNNKMGEVNWAYDSDINEKNLEAKVCIE